MDCRVNMLRTSPRQYRPRGERVKTGMTNQGKAVVTRLILREKPPTDPGGPVRPLLSDFDQLPGEVLHRALEELEARLHEIRARYHDGEAHRTSAPLRRLCAAAAQIGLPQVLAAAAGFSASCAAGDPVAVAATLARLTRACDAALSECWAFADLGA